MIDTDILDDLAADEATEERLNRRKYRYKLRINDEKRTKWDLFVLILSIWNCYSIPFDIAFHPAIFEKMFIIIMNNFVDVCFGIDIFLNFRTTFINR